MTPEHKNVPASPAGPHADGNCRAVASVLARVGDKWSVFVIMMLIDGPLRFNELKDPEPIPEATDYASVFESDVPIVVQHTRLDSRQSENALMTTVAFAGDS